MKLFSHTFFLFILFAGCKGKDRIPGDVLPQKKMQLVMWDLMRADQFLADFVLNRDTTKNKTTESLKYYQQIFAIHKISKDEFQHSFAFYKSHPLLLKAIMDSMSAPEASIAPKPENPGDVTAPLIVYPDTAGRNPGRKMPETGPRREVKPLITD